MKDYYDDYSDEYGPWRDGDAEEYDGPNLESYLEERQLEHEQQQQEFQEESDAPHKKKWIIFLGALTFIIILIFIIMNLSVPVRKQEQFQKPAEIPAIEPTTPKAKEESEGVIENSLNSLIFIFVKDRNGSSKSGSGFLINNRRILTNHHVIKNALEIEVSTTSGDKSSARVMDYDSDLDIASLILEKPVDAIPAKVGDSDQVELGTPVLVLGYPAGPALGKEPTITSGILSSIRPNENPEWFQIDAAVNPGNSGGPLIRKDTGEVIGVVTAKLRSSEGISFARPINRCFAFIY